jgi:hypothetical protein
MGQVGPDHTGPDSGIRRILSCLGLAAVVLAEVRLQCSLSPSSAGRSVGDLPDVGRRPVPILAEGPDIGSPGAGGGVPADAE